MDHESASSKRRLSLLAYHRAFGGRRCFVHSLDDYLALKNPAETDFFVRLEYDPAEKRFYPDEVPIYCTCSLPYNPDKFMVQCSICEEW